MPLSTLQGRARTFTADIVRDDQGRAVRIVGRLDGGWTDDDVAAALAAAAEDADRCSGCGHQLSDTTDPAKQFDWESEPIRCQACLAAAKTAHQFQPSEQTPHARAGLLVRTWLDDDGKAEHATARNYGAAAGDHRPVPGGDGPGGSDH